MKKKVNILIKNHVDELTENCIKLYCIKPKLASIYNFLKRYNNKSKNNMRGKNKLVGYDESTSRDYVGEESNHLSSALYVNLK